MAGCHARDKRVMAALVQRDTLMRIWSSSLGWRFTDAVHRNDAVVHGIALDIKPAAAAVAVTPLLMMETFGVAAVEQIIRPLFIGQGVGIGRPDTMRFAAITEFAFIA